MNKHSKKYDEWKAFIKNNYKFILIYVLLILFILVPLPYYVFTSGGTININDRIKIAHEYKSKGTLNLAYVNQIRATTPIYLMSFIIPSWDREKISEETLNKGEDTNDINSRDKLYLDTANSTAIKVAYELASKEIKITKIHNRVFYVDSLAKTDLKVGDEIIKADGVVINNISEYKALVTSSPIGKKINLLIKRGSKEREAYIYVKMFNKDKLTGISVMTNYEYTTNPKITINFKNGESGPSGGFMTALAIYNKLTKKDLTDGLKIVGTGTISGDGAVGEIGGVKYKLAGAEHEGADIFMAPAGDNYKECIKLKKKNNYRIKVIKVANIKDAIKYLANLKS